MTGFHVALIVLTMLTFTAWFVGLAQFRAAVKLADAKDGYRDVWPLNAGTVMGVILTIVLLIVGWMAVGPEYRLYRASVEKRIAVEEAKATVDAAVELAKAEVSRATGTAEANEIVADSITEDYLRYLYIDQLDRTQNQIIYIPTEAGLPILEAGRLGQPDE